MTALRPILVARTFYVAASSSPEGVSAARSLASRLEGLRLVNRMVNRMAWWEHLGAPESEWPALATRCLDSAFWCDVFVLLPEPFSHGAAIEFGARLTRPLPLETFTVGGGHEFFSRHPRSRRVESVEALLSALAHEERRT